MPAPIEMVFTVEPGCLFARVTGDVRDVTGAIDYTNRLMDECVRAQRRRLLVDETATRHHEPMSAAWRAAEHLVDRGIQGKLERVACVPHEYSWILARLFTAMLRQRGVSIRLFKSMAEARAWLEAP